MRLSASVIMRWFGNGRWKTSDDKTAGERFTDTKKVEAVHTWWRPKQSIGRRRVGSVRNCYGDGWSALNFKKNGRKAISFRIDVTLLDLEILYIVSFY